MGGRRRTIVERYRIQSARCYLTAVHNKSYSLKVIQYPIASPPVQGSRSQKSESPVIILSSFFVVVRQQSVGRRRRLKDTNYKQGLLLSYPVVCQWRQGSVWGDTKGYSRYRILVVLVGLLQTVLLPRSSTSSSCQENNNHQCVRNGAKILFILCARKKVSPPIHLLTCFLRSPHTSWRLVVCV